MLKLPSWARKSFDEEPPVQEPRLADHAEPEYSTTAKDAFVDVLLAANHLVNQRMAFGYEDVRKKASEAFDVAVMYCNPTLRDVLDNLRDTVFLCAGGRASAEDVESAKAKFRSACRVALGTDK